MDCASTLFKVRHKVDVNYSLSVFPGSRPDLIPFKTLLLPNMKLKLILNCSFRSNWAGVNAFFFKSFLGYGQPEAFPSEIHFKQTLFMNMTYTIEMSPFKSD